MARFRNDCVFELLNGFDFRVATATALPDIAIQIPAFIDYGFHGKDVARAAIDRGCVFII
jgi:hypothetical protein